MKLAVAFGAVLAAATFAVSPAGAADAAGHIDFFLGQKYLADDIWKPIDRQPEFGAVMSFGQDNWPVHIAVDVLVSACQDSQYDPSVGNVENTGWTLEVDLGVRKIWKQGKIQPYIEGGITSVVAEQKVISGGYGGSDRDLGQGFWAGTGVLFRLGSRFELGCDVRYSYSVVELGDVYYGGLNGSGFQYGVLLGFGL